MRRPVRNRLALGIDFGGTAVKLGLIREDGNILCKTQFLTSEASTPVLCQAHQGGIGKPGCIGGNNRLRRAGFQQ